MKLVISKQQKANFELHLSIHETAKNAWPVLRDFNTHQSIHLTFYLISTFFFVYFTQKNHLGIKLFVAEEKTDFT